MTAREMPGGYAGKVLRVDLTNDNLSVEELDEQFLRKYIGGAGFVAHYLLNEMAAGIDPLGPENKLVFAAGPVTGLAVPGGGRNCVGAKSPLTGGFAKSEVGGMWGAELKHAGFDAIVVDGRAERPVYLSISDGEASLRDARHLWGMKAKETEQAIRGELGDDRVRLATIGPAGENLVRYACIINDLHNAAGRGGTGAVMGSKNLKAIAVRGTRRPPAAQPERLKRLRKWVVDNRPLWAQFNELGTGGGIEANMVTGNLPIHNFRDGELAGVEQIGAEALRDTIRVGMETCYGCPVRCKKVVRVDGPRPVDPAYGGPEYETLASLGSNCGITDLKAIAKGNELCNAYTLDTISTGDVISFAMECFENGLLTTKDTGGIELRFGNVEAMLATIDLIAARKGIGDLLAEGTALAARKIGGDADEFAMHVKGLEIAMHEPRVKAALGLGYSVNPHGADHCANLHDTMLAGPGLERLRPLGILEALPPDDLGPAKVSIFRYVQQERIVRDCLVLCLFVPYGINEVAEAFSAATGWNTGPIEMLRVGERVLTMARLFNIREGFSAADDNLPNRFFQPKRNGVLSDRHYDRDEIQWAKSYYYSLMGWDPATGVPTPERMADLGIA